MIRRIVLFVLLSTPFLSGHLLAANGLKLVGRFDVKHGTTSGVSYSGSWGYVGPDGREYAILGTATGTAIIEISDTDNIHEIAHITGPTSIWREMRTYKNRLYIVSEGGNGTTIVDLSGLPSGVRVVKNFVYTSGAKNTIRSHTIEIFDGYMYLNGCANWGLSAQRGAVIFSLADPDNPAFVGEYSPNYFHDSYVRNDTIYGASIYSGGGIYIADIHDKSAPIPIGKISYAGSGTHNLWTTTNGTYLISTDEIGGTPKTLKFWDMQNLPTIPPSPASTYQITPSDIEHNVFVRGNYAYTAWYTAGVAIVDVHEPLTPFTAGFYDTSNDTLYPPGNYDGVWAMYPYFWSGKVTAGDMQNGLYVFTFDSLQARTPTSLLSPANQSVQCNPDPLTFQWTRVADPVTDPHKYLLGINGNGLDTLIDAGTDTSFTIADPAFLPAGTFSWWVVTKDEANLVSSQDTFTFTRPAPALSSPNGGEVLKIHNQITLHWSWSCTDSIELSYSTNDGVTWTPIATVAASESTYDWTIPIAPTTHGRIRVRDAADPNLSDISDASFTIFNSAAITLTSPNGAEAWKSGDVHQISWSALLVDSVGIDFSTDDGATWLVVESSVPGAGGTYGWSVPSVSTSHALVRVTDKSNLTVLDQSDARFTITPHTFGVESDWNLISAPVIPAEKLAHPNFSGASSALFRYDGTYSQSDSLSHGTGYWIKYGSSQTLYAVGDPFDAETLLVKARWNIVGALTNPVAVSSIVVSPGSMALSPVYGYTDGGGYEITDSLHPGRGYWVKASETGSLVIQSGPSAVPAQPGRITPHDFSGLNTVTFSNGNGKKRIIYYTGENGSSSAPELFELPPVVPGGAFDVRFASQRAVEVISPNDEKLISIISDRYPVTVSWDVKGAQSHAALAIDGRFIQLIQGGSARIAQPPSNISLRFSDAPVNEAPAEFSLAQNYPNPFNPSTSIRFDLPEGGIVTLKVYNILDQEVATLLDHQRKDAGSHAAEFRAENLPSGVYLYRISVESGQKQFSSMRKMILLR